jgi:hypothetical protein
MKHWGELIDLESAIIRVGEFKNLYKLLVAGTENHVDIKILQSAIYTMEGMIDDIDSTLYEKFQTVFDAVRDDETEGGEEEEFEEEFEEEQEEFEFDSLQEEYENAWPFDNMNGVSPSNTFTTTPYAFEHQGSTVQINSTSEEDEAFKDLEKAIKNWKPTAP